MITNIDPTPRENVANAIQMLLGVKVERGADPTLDAIEARLRGALRQLDGK